jgi:predicted metal-dependent peptidase
MNHEKSLQDTIVFKMLTDSKYVFYGLFLAELNKVFDDKFPTACVGKHPSSATIQLVIGRNFWENVCRNESMRKGILIHELEHVIREHLSEISSSMFPDRKIGNIAMDVSINQTITEELPRTDEEGNKMGAFIEDFHELNLKPNESTLYYYRRLIEAKEAKQDSAKKGQPSKSGFPGTEKAGTSGSKTLDEFIDGDVDLHELWKQLMEGMGDKEKDLFRKEIQEQIRRVAEETQRLKGNVPVHISNSLKEDFGMKPPVVNWKTLFNRFIGSTITTEVRQTRKRPNFRFEDAPTNKYKNKIKIVVGCDSSGSVSDEELKEFFGQIKHMYNSGTKVYICIWDAQVHTEYEYKGEMKFERICQGGTYASSFIEYVNKHAGKEHWTCAINMTDGYIEQEPIACKIPLLWVITNSGNTEFTHRSKKIKMN